MTSAGREAGEGGSSVTEAPSTRGSPTTPNPAVQDPVGFLERMPELRGLLYLPAVARAVAAGDGLTLYRVLSTQANVSKDVPRLLADRRMFLTPIKSAPPLTRINGFGSTLLTGSAFPDGTCIGTLWLTALFIPVFPLGQYLVRPAGGRSYYFLGKVPGGSATRAMRLAVGGIAAACALFAVVAALLGGRHSDMHFINGLDFPVAITAGAERVEVKPGQRVVKNVATGKLDLVVTTAEGQELAREQVEVPAYKDVIAYNVLGAAPLYAEGVIYTAGSTPTDEKGPFTLYANQRFVVRDDVDYPFQEPPDTIQMSTSQSRATRWTVAVAEGGWKMTLGILEDDKKLKEAAELAMRVSEVSPASSEAHAAALYYLHKTQPDQVAAFAAKLIKRFPDSEEIKEVTAVMAGDLDEDEEEEDVESPPKPAAKAKIKITTKAKKSK